jgi:hypothetical protein
VWARAEPGSSLDALEDPVVRGLVVDLGSLPTREEQSLVAGVVLERLSRRRAQREPILVVIDEAHNVCPAEPVDALTALATEYAVRIAAEGRKFGLYLLTSTQRPQKVHPNVASQCDNLVLMRMNPRRTSLTRARCSRSSRPACRSCPRASRWARARRPRIAEEGGADVPSTWAQTGPQSPHGGPLNAARR